MRVVIIKVLHGAAVVALLPESGQSRLGFIHHHATSRYCTLRASRVGAVKQCGACSQPAAFGSLADVRHAVRVLICAPLLTPMALLVRRAPIGHVLLAASAGPRLCGQHGAHQVPQLRGVRQGPPASFAPDRSQPAAPRRTLASTNGRLGRGWSCQSPTRTPLYAPPNIVVEEVALLFNHNSALFTQP